jgi:hypothetical protein
VDSSCDKLNKEYRQTTMGCPSAWGFGEGLRNCYLRRMMINLTQGFGLDGCLERSRQRISVVRIREKKNTHRILVGRPKKRRPLGRSRCKWEDNIKLGFKEGDGKDWTGLV